MFKDLMWHLWVFMRFWCFHSSLCCISAGTNIQTNEEVGIKLVCELCLPCTLPDGWCGNVYVHMQIKLLQTMKWLIG